MCNSVKIILNQQHKFENCTVMTNSVNLTLNNKGTSENPLTSSILLIMHEALIAREVIIPRSFPFDEEKKNILIVVITRSYIIPKPAPSVRCRLSLLIYA